MKSIFGVLLMILGLVLGLYVGVWICFVGGWIDVLKELVHILKDLPISYGNIGVGLLKIVCSTFVGFFCFYTCLLFGITLIKNS